MAGCAHPRVSSKDEHYGQFLHSGFSVGSLQGHLSSVTLLWGARKGAARAGGFLGLSACRFLGPPSACRSTSSSAGLLLSLGLAWPGLAWLGLAWLGLAWPGLAWLGLAWFGLAWLGLAWLGFVPPRVASRRVASRRVASRTPYHQAPCCRAARAGRPPPAVKVGGAPTARRLFPQAKGPLQS